MGIILDLCGGTGSWSKPYSDAGYEVINVTLPDTDVRTYKPPKGVIGILAAPPCTMFSLARTRAKTPRDFKEGMECVTACLNIVWQCRYEGDLKFWALENPMGYLRQFLGIPRYTFEPHYFGDLYTKKTDLWGYFRLPKRTTFWGLYKLKSMSEIARSARKRAITPIGFAKAFYKANNPLKKY